MIPSDQSSIWSVNRHHGVRENASNRWCPAPITETLSHRDHHTCPMVRYSPWRVLAAQNHITVRISPLPAGVSGACRVLADGAVLILLASSLDARERVAVLAHELLHIERGIGRGESCPEWRAVEAREEEIIDRQVAGRLLPTEELAAWIRARGPDDEAVTTRVVADEWFVSEPVARRALEAVARQVAKA